MGRRLLHAVVTRAPFVEPYGLEGAYCAGVRRRRSTNESVPSTGSIQANDTIVTPEDAVLNAARTNGVILLMPVVGLARIVGTPNYGVPIRAPHSCVAHVFERYVHTAPALFRDHLRGGTPLTLCHPDNITSNFLFPRQPGPPIYLIDWHVYRVWWGPLDLAALLTRAVPPEPALRDALLRRYYTQLLVDGVMHYSWDTCVQDYRFGLIDTLRVVLGQRQHAKWALLNLERIMPEFSRHGCGELLG